MLRGAGEFDNVITVQGARREAVEQALAAARAQLDRAHAEGKRTLFLFYYSGHGDQEALELGSSRLPLRDLRSYLEQLSGADVRVAFVDACQSGALTGREGRPTCTGLRDPSGRSRQRQGHGDRDLLDGQRAVAGVRRLGGSFFTHNIMAGLRGAADSSHDGQVTLGEVYQFAFRRTLASTAASLVGGQHPTYDYRMSGAGDVILARTRPNDARLVFPRETGVTYTVVNKGRGEVIAELGSTSAEDVYLALPAGEYRVVRRVLASVSETTFSLAAGSSTVIDTASMAPVLADAENHREKGGPWQPNSLGINVGLQSSPVPGTGSLVGTGCAFLHAPGRQVRTARARRVFVLRCQLSGLSVVVLALRALARRTLASLLDRQFRVAAGANGGHAHRAPTRCLARQHLLLRVDLRRLRPPAMLRTYRSTWLVLSAQGGGEVFRLNNQPVQRATVGMSLGGLLAF